jgi:prepilin-type N-terminal cleavage/methylation domain-containing protein
MPAARRQSAGFSLIELLIVITVLGILAGLILPKADPAFHDQLRAAAQILRTDLAYARSLAVANSSTYRITFDTANNRYVLEHSGSRAALDTLPESPFRNAGDPPDQHIVDLDELPHVGSSVKILSATRLGAAPSAVDDVEFGPLGETTRSSRTAILLSAGHGPGTRFMKVIVNPVSGLADVEYVAPEE